MFCDCSLLPYIFKIVCISKIEEYLGHGIIRNDRKRTCSTTSENLDQPRHSRGAFWIVNDAKFLHADNEDADRTAGCAG